MSKKYNVNLKLDNGMSKTIVLEEAVFKKISSQTSNFSKLCELLASYCQNTVPELIGNKNIKCSGYSS
ncbi:MAG: hypothetical protein V1779_09110 [bacterium]